MRIILNVDLAKSLYLDERGSRVPEGNKHQDFFFIGGVDIYDNQKELVADFVRQFKNELYPKEDNSLWELKGAGNPRFDKGGIKSAQAKWAAWTKHLESTKFEYNLYGTFIKLSLFKESNPEATELDIIKKAFLSVTESFLNCGAIRKISPQDEESTFEILPSTFVFDNVDNLQEAAINEAFEEYSTNNKDLAERFALGKNLKILSSDNYDDTDELIMQFVDMQIFALTKFLYPIRKENEDPKGKMFINFEEYPYKLSKLQSGELSASTEELKEMSEFFSAISPLFHHLRNKFVRCGWDDTGEQCTSLSLIADRVYPELGIEAHGLMADFCNICRYPKGKLFDLLNN